MNDSVYPSLRGSRIEHGTVGWPEDGGTFYEIGSGSNDGYTLVRVTLFAGRTPDSALDQTQAQGHRLLCMIGGGCFRIPARGTRVLVAIPETGGEIPGASIILTTIEKNPLIQFAGPSGSNPGRVMLDFGDVPVVIRGSCVVIESTASPTPQFISVGTPPNGGPAGIMMSDETGSGLVVQSGVIGMQCASGGDAKTLLQMTASTVDVINKAGGSQFQLDGSGNVSFVGSLFKALCGGGYLGINAVTLPPASGTGIAYYVGPPVGADPVVSTHWFISP